MYSGLSILAFTIRFGEKTSSVVMKIIIRGPLGVGKTTIAKLLADRLDMAYISVDQILNDHHLTLPDGIPLENFLKANEIIKELVRGSKNRAVIDGNFYYQEQLDDLVRKLDGDVSVFTLKAPVETCIARDGERPRQYGEDSTRFVHMMTSKFDSGIVINTEHQTLEETMSEMIKNLRTS